MATPDSRAERQAGAHSLGSESAHERPAVGPAKILAWVCLAIPFVVMLWVGLYAKREPRLAGFPFFFWFQLVFVFVASALTWIAYLIYSREDAARRARRTGSREEDAL